MPMYGPFLATLSYGPLVNTGVTNDRNSYWRKNRWKSRPKRSLRLPYDVRQCTLHAGSAALWPADCSSYITFLDETYTTARNQVLSKAYDRFKDAYGETASLAVTLAERKQTVQLVRDTGTLALRGLSKSLSTMYAAPRLLSDAASTLLRFTRAVKKFRFDEAAKILGIKRPQGLKRKSKEFSSNFLAYNFGWAPLVADIGSAVEVLSCPVKDVAIKASAVHSEKTTWRDSGQYAYAQHNRTVKMVCRLQADVALTNPNLGLAQKMGFVNPLTILWELVPWSFVVDWFSNVGQILESYTDFWGSTLSQPTTTLYGVERWSCFTKYYSGASYWDDRSRMSMKRSLGITTPKLFVRPFQGFSVKRGLTAIALLVQQLKN